MYVPAGLCSHRCMFHLVSVPTAVCFSWSMFPQQYLLAGLRRCSCSPAAPSSCSSRFPQLQVPAAPSPAASSKFPQLKVLQLQVLAVPNTCSSVFPQLYVSKTLCSHSSKSPKLYVPTAACSQSCIMYVPTNLRSHTSIFLHLYVPAAACFHGSFMFQQLYVPKRRYVPTALCSQSVMFPQRYVPKALCFHSFTFPPLHVSTSLCSQLKLYGVCSHKSKFPQL